MGPGNKVGPGDKVGPWNKEGPWNLEVKSYYPFLAGREGGGRTTPRGHEGWLGLGRCPPAEGHHIII